MPDVHVHFGGNTVSTGTSSLNVLGDRINVPDFRPSVIAQVGNTSSSSIGSTLSDLDTSLNIVEPPLSIHDALIELDFTRPDGNYIGIEKDLKAIGVSYIDEMLALDPRSMSEVSGIPIVKIAVVIAYAKDKIRGHSNSIFLCQQGEPFVEKENVLSQQ